MLLLLIAWPAALAQDEQDVLGMMFDSVGYTRADIGFHPKGYWNRYPLDIPYRLTSFDDLFAEPFKLIDYARTMEAAAEKYLDPAFLDTTSLGLYYLTYSLGVDRKQGGFRNYSPNLIPVKDSVNPLEKALERLYLASGEQAEGLTFGTEGGWPPFRNEIKEIGNHIDKRTELILAAAVVNLEDIIRWRNLAFRRCDVRAMQKVYGLRDLSSTQSDGTVYHPEIDDIAATIDWPSLHYAGLKGATLAEFLADSLDAAAFASDKKSTISTPYGDFILIGKDYFKKSSEKRININNALLVIDFGADGNYSGCTGANGGLSNPVSIFIDLGGNDKYPCETDQPSLGAGILGIGVFYEKNGNDNFDTKNLTQGCGLFGVGIMFDREGIDKYSAELSAQGCGYFGIGLCFDASGDDEYYLYGDGQGYGGVGGGVGVLADFSGNDRYTGEPYSEVFNRGDYHSENKINGNGVQGVGFGRRGDGSDGHSWAGGLGAIIDIYGNDHYRSGNWSLGCAYWFSTGIAVDKSGDDYYESCYFTQGSGAHYCNGILLDEGGADRHELFETAGAGLGFGWDYTNAFLINIGGDDSYYANMISMGLAQIRSNAFLVDVGGNDKYLLKKGTPGLGEATYREDYRFPRDLAPYYYYSKSFGGFIDIGGQDEYISFDDTGKSPHFVAANNTVWFNPSKSDSTYGADNFGVGVDIEDGIIPELEKWNK